MTQCVLQVCLIMDEVDGMSGGDRGGVQDLIRTIKRTKVPIIAICNDRYNQKLKSLRNSCMELEYRCGPACQAFIMLSRLGHRRALECNKMPSLPSAGLEAEEPAP